MSYMDKYLHSLQKLQPCPGLAVPKPSFSKDIRTILTMLRLRHLQRKCFNGWRGTCREKKIQTGREGRSRSLGCQESVTRVCSMLLKPLAI